MILDVLLWLPTKVLGRVLQPVTAMLDDLGAAAEETIQNYAEEHGIKL